MFWASGECVVFEHYYCGIGTPKTILTMCKQMIQNVRFKMICLQMLKISGFYNQTFTKELNFDIK